MAKLLFYVVACLCLVLTCNAAVYIVGGTSGWDVSTDLQSWVKNKTFNVGDVLLFQLSSSSTVNEVTRDSFNACNVTRALQIYTAGSTSVPLTKPGDRFFVSGNKLYCLGGMKLLVHVNGSKGAAAGVPASAPVLAPQASTSLPHSSTKNNNLAPQASTSHPRPSTKNKNASPNSSASDGSLHGGRDSLVAACLGAVVTLLLVVIV